MVQPNYSPKEALEKMKLLMKYDTSKTLNENVEVIKEQTIGQGSDVAGVTALGAGAAAAGLAAGGAAGSVVPIVGTIVGAGIGYGVGTLVQYYHNKDKGARAFKDLMGFCTNSAAVNSIPRGLSNQQVKNLAYEIEDAKGSWNDDEDAIIKALQGLVTVSDLCYLNTKIQGGLYTFLDDLTDSPDEWKQFTRPVDDLIENSTLKVADDTKKDDTKKDDTKKDDTKKDDGGKSKYTYTYCPETFPIAQFCKNTTISKVQSCLGGIRADGAFGPKTQAALEAKGLPGTQITQNSVDTACGGGGTNKPDEGEETTMVDPTQR
jgi:hypothetical protein